MFTGIIQHTGKIAAVRNLKGGLEFDIECAFAGDTHIDESISINGVCQTVTASNSHIFTVQTVEETLRKTTLELLVTGDLVNLERCLTLNTRIEGHLVQGHVDTAAEIVEFSQEGTNWLLTVKLPGEFKNLIVGRGSIAIDGISLTIARDLGDAFTVAIIPYTYEHTNLKHKTVGDKVNLEFDIMGKYILKYLKTLSQAPDSTPITLEKLKDLGY